MSPRRLVPAALVVLLLVGGGFFLFERHERGALAGNAERECGDLTASTADALPLGLPLSEGEQVLRVDSQGSTTVAFASVPGSRDDIVDVRDRVLRDLEESGYTVEGSDQEPGYEAEAELGGVHEGTLKVSPLCEGLLEVRYAVRD